MSREYPRSYRVADQIHRELAELIAHGLKDPGVRSLVTISEVEVTRDLSIATVFFSVLSEESPGSTLQSLERASGYLRRQLASRLRLRNVPQLRFRHDRSSEHGQYMDALIDAAVRRDRPDEDEPS